LRAYTSDADTPVGELTYALYNTPSTGAGVTLDGNRYVTVNPSVKWCGGTDVTIRVTDPGGLWDTDDFRVAVSWSCSAICFTPGPPVLVAPPDGSTTTDNTPTFDWNVVGDADEYQIQVDDFLDFSSPERDEITISTGYTPVSDLSDGVYYWRVRGHSIGGGCDVYGDWSSTWSIHIVPDLTLIVIPPTWIAPMPTATSTPGPPAAQTLIEIPPGLRGDWMLDRVNGQRRSPIRILCSEYRQHRCRY
jgi:hypothetical protein